MKHKHLKATATVILLALSLSVQAQFTDPIAIAPNVPNDYQGRIEAVDLDGDGDLDLVFRDNTGLVWVQNVDGEGNFGATINLAATPTHFAVADVDGDGDLDIVLVDGSGQVVWLANVDGNGTFGLPQLVIAPTEAVDVLICADLNGDGLPEVAYTSNVAGEAVVQVGINLGGAFAPPIAIPFGIVGSGLRLLNGDMDQDGNEDLVSLDGDGIVRVLRNVSGDATAWELVEVATTQPAARLHLVDVDDDGDLDILMTDWGLLQWAENSSTSGAVLPFVLREVYTDDTANHWGYPVLLGCGPELSIIHFRGLSGNLYWTKYDPVTETFSIPPPGILLFGFGGFGLLSTADLDGDGRQDVLHISNGLKWFRNELPVAPEPDEVTLAPFDILCELQGPYELDQASPSGGQWTGPGVEANQFDPSLTGVGTFTLTYQVATPCPLRAEAEIIVQASTPEEIELLPFDTLCASGGAYPLDGFATPSGGTWSGPGVEGNVFTPFGTGSFELSYTSSAICAQVEATIEVIGAPTVEVITGTPGGCNLEPVVLAAQPSGGTWGGLADANGLVDQSCAVRPIGGNATYTYHAPNGDCSESAFGAIFLNSCLPPRHWDQTLFSAATMSPCFRGHG